MRLLSALAASASLGAALALAPGAPALADSQSVADPGLDLTIRARGFSAPNADIRRTTTTLAGNRVTTVVEVEELAGDDEQSVYVRLLTSRGRSYVAELGRLGGQKILELGELDDTGTIRSVSCDGLKGSLAPATETMKVSVPRTCLRTPSWVRFGALTSATQNFDDGSSVTYTDDARRNGNAGSSYEAVKVGNRQLFLD